MKPERLHCLVFAAILLLCSTFAHASQTQLIGTITDAMGNGLNGTLVMYLPFPAQDQTTNTAVSPTPVYFSLVNGSVGGGAALYDVANLQPQGLYYTARGYDTSGALVFYGNYAVTGSTFNLGAAVPTSVTTSNVSYILPIFPNQTNNFTVAQQFAGIDSDTTPNASTGYMRLGNTDTICWRNTANNADDCMGAVEPSGSLLDATYFSALDGIVVNAGVIASGAGQSMTLTSTAPVSGAGPSLTLEAASATGANLSGGTINLIPGSKNGSASNGTINIAHGMGSTTSSNGFQHKRVGSCTTGAAAGDTCTTTINWNVAFDDTNYTAVCVVSGGTVTTTGVPYVLNTISKTTSQMSITIAAFTAAAAAGELDCIGVHD